MIIVWVLLWLITGFIGRCMMKHYFIAMYGGSLGKEAFGWSGEILGTFVILAGLAGLIGSLIPLAFFDSYNWIEQRNINKWGFRL